MERFAALGYAPIASLVFLAPFSMLGCDGHTGLGFSEEVRIEVDPVIVRTIHHYAEAPGLDEPPSEVTTLALDDIECLHTTPRGCRVHETIRAGIQNLGSRALRRSSCDQPLERWGLGSWHPVTRRSCPMEYSSRSGLLPGEMESVHVEVDRAPPGLYRVRFTLYDGGRTLDPLLAASAPFQLEPLPDSPAFVCPSESRAELAGRIAQEALDSAWAGGPTPDVPELLVIENLVPGFGGLYRDNGRLTAWLQDLALGEWLVEVVQSTGRGTPVVRRGDFSFSELVGWKEAIFRSGVFGILGVSGIDADEAHNRVSIGIANELIQGDVQCFVKGIGMPEGMARVVVE